MIDEAERFTAMYDACRQRVWAYATSRAGRQIADEVVSETFAVAWRRLDDVPEPPLPWLLGVARNLLRENYRAEARREAFVVELRTWGAPAAEDDVAEAVADRLAVLRAMAGLPEDDREVLILVAWQGLSPRDAARVVGCSPAALRVRLHRARKRLAAAAEATDGEPPAKRRPPAPPPPAVSPPAVPPPGTPRPAGESAVRRSAVNQSSAAQSATGRSAGAQSIGAERAAGRPGAEREAAGQLARLGRSPMRIAGRDA